MEANHFNYLTLNRKPEIIGIRFDKSFSSCLNCLNLLKVVAKRKYGLNKKMLEIN